MAARRRSIDIEVTLATRDRALLILAGAIALVSMACVTVLILVSDATGVAAGIGVFTAASTVAGTAVGRIGPARTTDPPASTTDTEEGP